MVSSQHFVLIFTALEELGGRERYIHVTAKIPRQAPPRAQGAASVRTKAFSGADCGPCGLNSIFNVSVPKERDSQGKKPSKVGGGIKHRRHCNSDKSIFLSKNSGSLKHGMSYGEASILISEEASMKTLANHTHPAAGKHSHSAIFFP